MSRLSRIVWRTLKPIRSEFRPDVVHPAGSEGWPVTPIDAKLGVCLFEIRVPDDQLVGGASYDVVTVDVSDLEVDDSAPWAMAPARQAGEAFKSFDGQAAKSVGGAHRSLSDDGASRSVRREGRGLRQGVRGADAGGVRGGACGDARGVPGDREELRVRLHGMPQD